MRLVDVGDEVRWLTTGGAESGEDGRAEAGLSGAGLADGQDCFRCGGGGGHGDGGDIQGQDGGCKDCLR